MEAGSYRVRVAFGRVFAKHTRVLHLTHSRGSRSCIPTTAACKTLHCGEDLGWGGFAESHR